MRHQDAAASAPFVGTFAPEGNLAAFIGQQSSGICSFGDDTIAATPARCMLVPPARIRHLRQWWRRL